MADFSRLPDDLRSRVRGLLDRDTTDADLDRAHEQLHEELRDVEEAITDVAAERERLRERVAALREDADRCQERAEGAVAEGREDDAREALRDKHRADERAKRLEDELDNLAEIEGELVDRRDDLARRADQFETEKERLKARKTAAEAEADAAESETSGVADAERTAESATDRVRDAEARAAALDELREEGVFDGPLAPDDGIEAELDEAANDRAIENELETIRQELDEGDGDEN